MFWYYNVKNSFLIYMYYKQGKVDNYLKIKKHLTQDRAYSRPILRLTTELYPL